MAPGDWLELVSDADVTGVANGDVDLGFLAPPVEHISINWQELNSALDHCLEMVGVPNSIIRMVQSGAQSGTAIQSEQLPLLTWVEGRRGDWQSYEEDAARMVFTIAEVHTRQGGVKTDAGRYKAVLDDWEFSVQWPNLFTQLPGPQRDQSDQWLLEQGLTNKVTVLMERNGFTETEAFNYLAKLNEQDQKLLALGIDPKPAAPPSPFGKPAPDDVMSGEGDQQGQPNPFPAQPQPQIQDANP
jgi:hypothetical protein